MDSHEIFHALRDGRFEEVRHMVNEDHKIVHIKDYEDSCGRTPLDYAIKYGNLEIVQFLWEKGSRANPDAYLDKDITPAHRIKHVAVLEWVFFEKGALPLRVFNIRDPYGMTPLDDAIAFQNLEMAKLLWEINKQNKRNKRPNHDISRNRYLRHTPVHWAALYGKTATLEWIYTEGVFPLHVFNAKNHNRETPLDVAIHQKKWETVAFLRRLMYVDPVFLAMHRAKRDHPQCVLRRLPNELLDMIVDEVASRHGLKVVW